MSRLLSGTAVIVLTLLLTGQSPKEEPGSANTLGDSPAMSVPIISEPLRLVEPWNLPVDLIESLEAPIVPELGAGSIGSEKFGPFEISSPLINLLRDSEEAPMLWETLSSEEQEAIVNLVGLGDYFAAGTDVHTKLVNVATRCAEYTEDPEETEPESFRGLEIVVLPGSEIVVRRGNQILFGEGPGTLSLSETHSISNQWSATFGLSANAVNASVGFDVTKTNSVNYSYSFEVPSEKTYALVALNIYLRRHFQVWQVPLFGQSSQVGEGWADSLRCIDYLTWEVSA